MPDLHDAVDVAEGERLEEDLVDDAEDGGVGSDAEGHDDGCDQGEAGVFDKQSESESKILQESCHTTSSIYYRRWQGNRVATRRNVSAKNYQDLGKRTMRTVSIDENLCSFSNAAQHYRTDGEDEANWHVTKRL